MKIQINSDNTISADDRLVTFAKTEVKAGLERFAKDVTRVEVHLSDIDGGKSGQPDKRCLIEVRPAGSRPLSASAVARRLDTAIRSALGKARRALTTFLGKQGRDAARPATKKAAVKKSTTGSARKTVAKKSVAPAKTSTAGRKSEAAESPERPKKKRIYQARRKAWPARKA